MTAQLTQWIADLGLAGVFALMAVDAVLPAGGELVMLFAGALAAGAIAGHDGPSLVAVIAAGTLGYLAGSIGGWALGKAGGEIAKSGPAFSQIDVVKGQQQTGLFGRALKRLASADGLTHVL